MTRLEGALACALCAAVVSGCSPEDRSGSVDAWVWRLEPDTHEYALRRDRLDHLESLRGLQGEVFAFRARGRISFKALGGVRVEIDRGDPLELDYVDRGGAVVAADLASLYAMSAYRNLDRVATFFAAHGYQSPRLDAFVYPEIDSDVLGDMRTTITDNAAFASFADGFLLVPGETVTDQAFLLNEGVLAHEFGHSMLHHLRFTSAEEERSVIDALEKPVQRAYGAANEGMADLAGFVETGDPDYIAVSLAEGLTIDRDLAAPVTLTPEEVLALVTATDDEFDPHWQGSVMARAIYEAFPHAAAGYTEEDRARLADAVVQSHRDTALDPGFTLVSYPLQVARRLSPSERARACEVYRARFPPYAAQLENCEVL